METENSLVLREAAKDAKMAYFNHLSAGGKRDPDRERRIEALTDGADAITRTSVLASRLAQVERERDAAVKDLNGLMSQLKGQVCNLCRKTNTEECNWGEHLYHYCTPEWRGVCGENTKEKETLQEEETR